jgi:hypothetical protein
MVEEDFPELMSSPLTTGKKISSNNKNLGILTRDHNAWGSTAIAEDTEKILGRQFFHFLHCPFYISL